MPLLKKLLFLIILFFACVIFSVYNFDYESFLGKNDLTTSSKQLVEETTKESFIDKIMNTISSKDSKETRPFNLVLIKKDGVVIMNGLFANEEDTKKVANILNINRDGEYKYEKNRVLDEVLLAKLALLITPFKDFFADNSKLSVIDNQVTLVGELKDSNYNDLFESIISRIDIDLKKEIVVPAVGKIEENVNKEITQNITENSDNVLSVPPESVVEENKSTPVVNKNTDNNNKIQLEINKLLSQKKINFERKSSTLTQDSLPVLEEIAKILNQNQNVKVEISGHTDSRGKESLNKEISQQRASSVSTHLITLGVKQDRLTAIGYGEEFPIAKDDENGLSEINRRVEFKILGELK